MSDRLENNKVASRYAKALFDSVANTGELEAVAADLQRIREVLDEVSGFYTFMENPGIPQDEKLKVVTDKVGQGANPWVGRMLQLLAENARLPVFPQLVENFQELLNRHKNVALAEVVTAVELEDELRKRIAKTLEQSMGFNQVEIQNRVDPGILGGMIVKIQDRVIDGSYMGRLEALRKQIAKV